MGNIENARWERSSISTKWMTIVYYMLPCINTINVIIMVMIVIIISIIEELQQKTMSHSLTQWPAGEGETLKPSP